ncbi:hypothetical protein PR048_018064 [Dryococelus australis]|uniref:YqaJ viral recombinase domain-containing protein n=1 Tax=Dryococelus australis TaxID=614101 RepID=A0ABQ9HB90_9NEOP|nr:hypothetical protein PR048_018064 [Dryococelus australis]
MVDNMRRMLNECCLCIDSPYLGAMPDGLVNNNEIVEIKCPSAAEDLTPEGAVLSRKNTFWTLCKEKKNIIVRDICYNVVRTPRGMKVEIIERDDELWRMEMEQKLYKFYMDCLLPEFLYLRHPHSLPMRDPPYIIIEAQKAMGNKKRSYSRDSQTDNKVHKNARRKIL